MPQTSPAASLPATPSDRHYFDRVRVAAFNRRLAWEEEARLQQQVGEHGAKARFLADLTTAYCITTGTIEPCTAVEITAAMPEAIKLTADFFHGEIAEVLEVEFGANQWHDDLVSLMPYSAARLYGWEQSTVPPRRKPKPSLLLAGAHYGAAEEARLIWSLYCDQPDKIDPTRRYTHHEEIRVLDRDLLHELLGVVTVRSLLAVDIGEVFASQLRRRPEARIPTLRECTPTRAGVGGRRSQPTRQHDPAREAHQASIISEAMMLPDSVLGPGPTRAMTDHTLTAADDAADLPVDPMEEFAAVSALVDDFITSFGHLREVLPASLALRLERAVAALPLPRGLS